MIRRARTQRGRGGFTILEILTSVGLLVIVAAGAAAIFGAITETIDEGRKIAEINRFAARLERVMRQDFEGMTRDGFLVIVNQNAPGADPDGSDRNVKLSILDTADPDGDGIPGRPRRADEIMFFARGDFETSRRAISTAMIARSGVAAVYYGHGQQRRPNLDDDPDEGLAEPLFADNLFFNPKVTDTNTDPDARLGVVPTDGIPNPNEFASDWALLRHVTLIVDPQQAGQTLPAEVFGVQRVNEDRDWLEDNGRQVALQPAARSIFNALGRTGYFVATAPTNYTEPRWFRQYPAVTDAPPMWRASGLVDIAVGDLEGIKSVVTGLSADREPVEFWDPGTTVPPPLPDLGYEDFKAQFWGDDPSDMDDLGPTKAAQLDIGYPESSGGAPVPLSNTTPDNTEHIDHMRRWMIDALPSLWDQSTETPGQIARVRYEDVPARLLFGEDAFADNDDGDRDRAYAQADQEMLGSSVFLPRCTEFVVEWSYGFVNPLITDPADPQYKKVIWYGLDRWIDANDDGLIETNADPFAPEVGEDHRVARAYMNRPTGGLADIDRGPPMQLIVGREFVVIGGGTPAGPEIATFGYPDQSGNDWKWPKFIRVTLSLADPTDPTIEESFQMVFEIPEASQD